MKHPKACEKMGLMRPTRGVCVVPEEPQATLLDGLLQRLQQRLHQHRLARACDPCEEAALELRQLQPGEWEERGGLGARWVAQGVGGPELGLGEEGRGARSSRIRCE